MHGTKKYSIDSSSEGDDEDHPSIQAANQNPPPLDNTYVYRDFAREEDPAEKFVTAHAGHSNIIAHEDMRDLESQKLPAKLAAMLSDPDLTACITWMPHGRSWKILNRDLFSSYALPRYFGHTNHASFVRLVNAWGFRRIVSGLDKDSYYHELFLRGKSNLHCHMKRLPNAKKTPVNKEDKCPDFYEIAKSSPLPENKWQYHRLQPSMMMTNVGGAAMMGQSLAPFGAVGMYHGMNQMGGAAALAGMAYNPMMGGTFDDGGLGGGSIDGGAAAGGGNVVDRSSVGGGGGGGGQDTQQLLAATMGQQQNDNTSNTSIQSLVNQNQLLQALLMNSQAQAALAAPRVAGLPGTGAGGSGDGGGASGGGRYPYRQQNYSPNKDDGGRAATPAGGGRDNASGGQ